MLWYICGPMSNRPSFNVGSFLEAKDVLEANGEQAQLPADLDDPVVVAKLLASPDGSQESANTGLTWGDCLALDVRLIADVVDGICVLPGWQNSRGARLETFVAFLCGKPIVYYPTMNKVRKRQLAKAWLGHWGADLLRAK